MRAIRGVIREIGLWIRYFCVWPGLPPCGNPAEGADCILVQAFGRNSNNDAELRTIAELRQRCRTDLLAVEALHNFGFDAGTPNDDLARECEAVMNRYPNMVAIVQWEVAAGFDWRWCRSNSRRIICIWPGHEGYLSTTDVLKQSHGIMQSHRLKRPIQLAHRRHMVRAFLIARKVLGTEPIVLRQRTCSFDRWSVQFWTRTWYRWAVRETLARVHHLVTRKVW